ncbi:MAG: choice-of-anchor D domain-containing protein, partial [Pseudomonadota bacterium]
MITNKTPRSHLGLALCAALLVGSPAALANDRDGDGINNAIDNCVHVMNPAQWDSDADGIGNRCDPDFNNNGMVDDYDLTYLRDRFFTINPVADLDGDGRVGFADLAILKSYYGGAPGGVPRRAVPRLLGGEAEIFMDPSEVVAQLGQTFSVDVIMDFSTVTTIGGGFDILFDSDRLSFVDWTPNIVGDPGFSREPEVFDGLLEGIAVGDFDGLTGVFNLGTVEFQRVGDGTTPLNMQDSGSITGPFLDAFTFQTIPVLYTGAEVADQLSQEPSIRVEPDDLDLGLVVVGETSTADTVVTNRGIEDLVIGDVGVADALAAPFELSVDGCSGQTLPTDASCSLTVAFTPNDVSTFMDSFDVPSNDPARPVVTVTVGGEGVAGPTPRIAYAGNASPLDLGLVQLGEFGERFLRLESVGTADLVIGNIGDSDALEAPFVLTQDTCSGATLAPGETCQLRV